MADALFVVYVLASYVGTYWILRTSGDPDLLILIIAPLAFPLVVLSLLDETDAVKRFFGQKPRGDGE